MLREHSAILATFIIKVPFVFKTFVLSIFEWTLKIGFTVIKKQFSYFSTITYVVGTQKNRLNEMVLLSTQNICLN